MERDCAVVNETHRLTQIRTQIDTPNKNQRFSTGQANKNTDLHR